MSNTEFTDRDSIKLGQMLAKYAENFGKDSAESMTLKELADDLAESNSDPALSAEIETLRDRIYDGLNQ